VKQAAAAADRRSAALDRRLAAEDRHDAAVDRFSAGHDDLTGVLRRGIGLVQLQREIDRSRRLGSDLVVAFFDVDGLKRINDERGHAAGDEALRAVGDGLRRCLRSYDLIMRYGGDEFLTAQAGMNLAEASARVLTVQAELSTATAPLFVSFGLAQFEADDCIATLVARADADLYARRRRARGRQQDSDSR
jgi:diguanylate cyclase (GGDEF)-like protein